jgi:hypothetical protein
MILPKHGDSPNGEMRMTPAETETSAEAETPGDVLELLIVTRLIWGYLGETLADVYGSLWMFMDVYGILLVYYFHLFPTSLKSP